MAGDREKPRQVCDCCRVRKVKCDRGQPCKNCRLGNLRCQYLHSIRRTGPKKGRGRRQSQLRGGLTEIGADQFHVFTRESLSVGLGSEGSVESSVESSTVDSSSGQSQRHVEYSQPSPTPFGNQVAATPPRRPDAHMALTPSSPPFQAPGFQGGHLSLALVAHVHLFVKHMFPIMPVVDGDALLSDAVRLDELSPARYALLLALCAATRMQLGLDYAKNRPGYGLGSDIPPQLQLTGPALIGLAEASLRQYSVIDDASLDSMLASFFLFVSYGNLDNARHAWFYLNQTITLAQSLDITRESGYHSLPNHERERRRRVFWLLFVTERTFALQHRRTVMLRSTVTKPQVVDSDCPVVMNDFINHIRLFESLPWSLYEWQPESDNHQLKDLALVHTINGKLCSIQADQSVIESQRFDTLITQQWLRISMWRLAFGKKPSSSYKFGLLLPPGLPMDAGKMIMSALSSVASRSKDCHGIGMEQKLFDVGMSLADSVLLPTWNRSSFEVGPRDLLHTVVGALSTARGGQSHLLSELLKYSEDVLGLSSPAAQIDMRLDAPHNTEYTNVEAVPEDVSTQGEASVDPLFWMPGDELGLLDLSTPVPSPMWEEA